MVETATQPQPKELDTNDFSQLAVTGWNPRNRTIALAGLPEEKRQKVADDPNYPLPLAIIEHNLGTVRPDLSNKNIDPQKLATEFAEKIEPIKNEWWFKSEGYPMQQAVTAWLKGYAETITPPSQPIIVDKGEESDIIPETNNPMTKAEGQIQPIPRELRMLDEKRQTLANLQKSIEEATLELERLRKFTQEATQDMPRLTDDIQRLEKVINDDIFRRGTRGSKYTYDDRRPLRERRVFDSPDQEKPRPKALSSASATNSKPRIRLSAEQYERLIADPDDKTVLAELESQFYAKKPLTRWGSRTEERIKKFSEQKTEKPNEQIDFRQVSLPPTPTPEAKVETPPIVRREDVSPKPASQEVVLPTAPPEGVFPEPPPVPPGKEKDQEGEKLGIPPPPNRIEAVREPAQTIQPMPSGLPETGKPLRQYLK